MEHVQLYWLGTWWGSMFLLQPYQRGLLLRFPRFKVGNA